MSGSRLGTQIHILRKSKGITQEALGRALGVTAQAVSNWECGGTPDAEILPSVADFFEVSIDTLYGRSDEVKKNPGLEILWELYNTKKEERFEKAYEYCAYIHQGLYNLNPEILKGTLQDKMKVPTETKFTSVVSFEEGISLMRLNENIHSLYLLPTPAEGIKSELLSPETYEEFFSVMGRTGRVKALIFIYGRKALATSIERMAENLAVSEALAKEILEDLCSIQLMRSFDMETEVGSEKCYGVIEHPAGILALVPFLLDAADLIEKAEYNFNNSSWEKESLL